MKAVRTMFTSISARFDCLVSQLENHEALATSTIRDFESTAAKAKLHHRKLKTEISRLGHELTQLEGEMSNWKARAKDVHSQDPEKALACVERYKRAETKAAMVRQRIKESEAIESEVAKDVDRIVAKLDDIRRRKLSLSCRESCATALDRIETSLTSDSALDVFDRWEDRILESELRSGISPEIDRLEQEFSKEERRNDLAATLGDFLHESDDLNQPEQANASI